MLIAAVLLLGGLAVWAFMTGKIPGLGAERTNADSIAAARAADSTRLADSARAAAANANTGWIRLVGDLPEDAIIWLDEAQKRGRIIQANAGTYTLEIETGEFEPWEETVRVRAGDTVRVAVELVLKADSTENR